MTATPPYMMIAQHDDDSLSDEASKTLCDLQANQRGYFSFNTRGRTSERDPSWESSLGFWTNLRGLAKSFADPGEEVTFTLRLPDMLRKLESNLPSLDFNGQDRHDDGTEGSSQLGQRS